MTPHLSSRFTRASSNRSCRWKSDGQPDPVSATRAAVDAHPCGSNFSCVAQFKIAYRAGQLRGHIDHVSYD
jgi:hypothetical protein